MNKKLLVSLLATAWLPFTLLAQDEKPKPAQESASSTKAEARAVLERSAEAISKLKTASFQVRLEFVLPAALEMTQPAVEASVVLRRVGGDDPVGAHLKVTGRVTDPLEGEEEVSFACAYDGEKARSYAIAPQEPKVLWEATLEEGGAALLLAAGGLVASALTESKPLSGELQAEAVSLLPDERVGGEDCSVVEIVQKPDGQGEQRIRWAFAKSDHLPRQVQSLLRSQMGTVQKTLTLSALKTGVELDERSFALTPPEGFEVRKPEQPQEREPQERPTLLEVGAPAPDWTLKDPAGTEHKLSGMRGKVVVIDFWATWCPPCRKVMPAVQRLHERFADQGVLVFGLSTNESGDPVEYMRSKGFTYGLLLDADEVAKAYGVPGLPTFYVIGTDGRILAREVGASDDLEERMAATIEEHLRKS